MRILNCIPVLICFGFANLCAAQSADDWKIRAIWDVDQVLSPAEITDESLKYKLFDDSNLGSHNAASFYYRASLKWAALPKAHRSKLFERADVWFDAPMSDFPIDEVEQWLEKTKPVFKDLNKGLSGVCDWGLSGDEFTFAEQNSMGFVAELVVLDELGRILRLKARLHVVRTLSSPKPSSRPQVASNWVTGGFPVMSSPLPNKTQWVLLQNKSCSTNLDAFCVSRPDAWSALSSPKLSSRPQVASNWVAMQERFPQRWAPK